METRMRRLQLVSLALLSLGLGSCSDVQEPTSTDKFPALPLADLSSPGDETDYGSDTCMLSEIILIPLDAFVQVDGRVAYEARAVSRGVLSAGICQQQHAIQFQWSVGFGARLGTTSANLDIGYADVYGVVEGPLDVTVVASTPSMPDSRTITRVTRLTVTPKPSPLTATISGPTTVSIGGEHTFTAYVPERSTDPQRYDYQWWRRICPTCSSYSVASPVLSNLPTPTKFSLEVIPGEVNYFRVAVRFHGQPNFGPQSPDFAVDAVNAIPRPSVTVTGEDNIRAPGSYTWHATPSGGDGSYTYLWRFQRRDGVFVLGTQSSFTWTFDGCDGEQDFQLSVVVTSRGVDSNPAIVDPHVRYPNQCS